MWFYRLQRVPQLNTTLLLYSLCSSHGPRLSMFGVSGGLDHSASACTSCPLGRDLNGWAYTVLSAFFFFFFGHANQCTTKTKANNSGVLLSSSRRQNLKYAGVCPIQIYYFSNSYRGVYNGGVCNFNLSGYHSCAFNILTTDTGPGESCSFLPQLLARLALFSLHPIAIVSFCKI